MLELRFQNYVFLACRYQVIPAKVGKGSHGAIQPENRKMFNAYLSGCGQDHQKNQWPANIARKGATSAECIGISDPDIWQNLTYPIAPFLPISSHIIPYHLVINLCPSLLPGLFHHLCRTLVWKVELALSGSVAPYWSPATERHQSFAAASELELLRLVVVAPKNRTSKCHRWSRFQHISHWNHPQSTEPLVQRKSIPWLQRFGCSAKFASKSGTTNFGLQTLTQD